MRSVRLCSYAAVFLFGALSVAVTATTAGQTEPEHPMQYGTFGLAEVVQRVAPGDAFRWTAEYEDPFDLHDPESPAIRLTPGLWLVSLSVRFKHNEGAGASRLSVRVDGRKLIVLEHQRSTFLRISQTAELTVVNEIGAEDPSLAERQRTFVAVGDATHPRASELAVCRLSE